MNSTHLLPQLFSACLGLALLTPTAHAALPYNDGDVLLGFRATGGEGATTDYLVRIGSATQFTGGSGQFSVNIGNIKSDLEAIYGADWNTRGDLLWSVSGVQKTAGNGFPTNTMFATRTEDTPGSQSVPWTRPSAFGAGAPAGKMLNMGFLGYGAGTTADQMISTNNSKALIQTTNAANSYASFQPGGANTTGTTAFGYFASATGIEGNFANGTAGSVLDFYKLEPGSGPAVPVGAFKLDNNGNLTFSKDISPPTTVAIEQAAYQVNENVASLAINVVRSGTGGAAFMVNFSTTNDTAIAGTDFTGQTNVPVSFGAGENSKVVNVAITRRLGFQGNRQFGVALSNPTGGVSLGTINTATVSIIEVDPAPPTVAFSAANYPVGEGDGQVTVTLTRTGDLTAASTVNFSTSNGSALGGTDFTAQTDTQVSFAANETTTDVNVAITHRAGFQGNRSFNVVLSSPSGAILGGQNTATVTINEVDQQPATLVLSAATYSVAENAAGGTVAIVINRSGDTTAAGSVTFSTADGTALAGTDYVAQTNVPVDFAAGETTKTINVAVIDNADFQESRQFSVIISAPTDGGVLGEIAMATVTITDNDPPPGVIPGGYRGLITPTGTPSNETSGSITLDVLATGAFTGKLHLGGGTLPFSGKFDETGAAKFKPGSKPTLKLKLDCATPLDLGTMALAIVGDVITGTVNNPDVKANVHLERNAFDGLTPETTVDDAFLANGGKYTAVLPSKSQSGLAATAFPQGDGFARVTLNRKGKVTFTGTLADGKAFSATTKLDKNYTCPIYVSLYNMLGSIAGRVTFDIQTDSDFSGTDFLWVRPLVAKSTRYAAGWPSGVKVDVLGASYAISSGMSVFPGLGPVDQANGNAKIEIAAGKLTATITKNLNISTSDLVTLVPPTDTSVKITIDRDTGKVSGKFAHSDGTKPKFKGIIYQKGANRGAFGFFLSIVPRGGSGGESGGVSVTPK